jgi:hypothetical protein
LNRLVSSASSSSSSTLNSSSGTDIKEDKENILVDGLALDFPLEPPMRRDYESYRALNLGCHTPIHLSRLELREQHVHGQSVIYLRLYNGPNFSPQTVRSSECKSLTALS